MITIASTGGETAQGVNRPVHCNDDQGNSYIVKQAGRAGVTNLIKEWVAGHFAKKLGLPIPEFGIAICPSSIKRLLMDDERYAWGDAPSFASRYIPNAVEMNPTHAQDIPKELQAKILLFDLWIGNGDRGEGNPNLLWTPVDKQIHLIDHNHAFTDNLRDVLSNHIFSRMADHALFPHAWMPDLRAAESHTTAVWQTVPDEWREGCPLISLESIQDHFQSFWAAAEAQWSKTP